MLASGFTTDQALLGALAAAVGIAVGAWLLWPYLKSSRREAEAVDPEFVRQQRLLHLRARAAAHSSEAPEAQQHALNGDVEDEGTVNAQLDAYEQADAASSSTGTGSQPASPGSLPDGAQARVQVTVHHGDNPQTVVARTPLECRPLKTLEELRNWAPPRRPLYRLLQATVPLAVDADSGRNAHRPRLLICHDFQGGYKEDKFAQGCSDSGAYKHTFWQGVDAFVYFSHCFVTIPPVGWVNAAHCNGVPVLGTLITEWKEGAALCLRLFESNESAERAAQQLAMIARWHGFDGWLINIENPMPQTHVNTLYVFLRKLKELMRPKHERMPCGTVLWYDAVDVRGILAHQCTLNQYNAPFFKVTDGLFTDYHWQDHSCALAARNAAALLGDGQTAHAPYDIWMGVDVFGRGTWGGGEWQSHAAVRRARQEGLSTAIFAPGWTFEHGDRAHWPQRNLSWWSTVQQAWGYERAVVSNLPFYTAFCSGAGEAYQQNGRQLLDKPWLNLSLQDPQPLWLPSGSQSPSSSVQPSPEPALDLSPCSSHPYDGSASLRLTSAPGSSAKTAAASAGVISVTRLFRAQANLPVTRTLHAALTSSAETDATESDCKTLVALVLDFEPVLPGLAPESKQPTLRAVLLPPGPRLDSLARDRLSEHFFEGRSVLFDAEMDSEAGGEAITESARHSEDEEPQVDWQTARHRVPLKQLVAGSENRVSSLTLRSISVLAWTTRSGVGNTAERASSDPANLGASDGASGTVTESKDTMRPLKTSFRLGALMLSDEGHPGSHVCGIDVADQHMSLQERAGSQVAVSFLLTWTVEGTSLTSPGAPRRFAVWLKHCEEVEAAESWRCLGVTVSRAYQVTGAVLSKRPKELIVAVQQQYWHGAWQSLSTSSQAAISLWSQPVCGKRVDVSW